jgi:hypothetical protein
MAGDSITVALYSSSDAFDNRRQAGFRLPATRLRSDAEAGEQGGAMSEKFPNADQFEYRWVPYRTFDGHEGMIACWEQKRTLPLIDHERAKAKQSLTGDPMLAPPNSNYPAGSVVDWYCLACGSCFASHDEDSDCWRILRTEEELAEYDRCQEIADSIRHK